MNTLTLLAEAFAYPYPGLLEALQAGLADAPRGPARDGLSTFIRKIKGLSLEEWEELSTRTLDLSPAAAPYVGFQVWGESYQRGEFMSKLNHAMREAGIETEGELPDHLAPILPYLAAADAPIPELMENFEPAVNRMIGILREKDRKNPYLHLFD